MKKYRVTFTVTTDAGDDLERVIEHGLVKSQSLAWWHGHKWVVHDHTIEEEGD